MISFRYIFFSISSIFLHWNEPFWKPALLQWFAIASVTKFKILFWAFKNYRMWAQLIFPKHLSGFLYTFPCIPAKLVYRFFPDFKQAAFFSFLLKLYAKHFDKHFIYYILLNHQNTHSAIRDENSSLILEWEHWSSERISHLPEVTQLVNDETTINTHVLSDSKVKIITTPLYWILP